MQAKITRRFFLGFMQIHILHHAKKEAIYGAWIVAELQKHGYHISAGTLYPILHDMEDNNLLKREDILVNGKIRKYYRITTFGITILEDCQVKVQELLKELEEG